MNGIYVYQTEQVSLEVTLLSWTYIIPADFRGFPRSLQENAGIVRRFGHDCLLLTPFQFISHPTIRRYGFSILKA
jgi:hypothetical protein